MGISISKLETNQRKLFTLAFSLFSAWMLTVPFEGQVLYSLFEKAKTQGSWHNTFAVFIHFIGLICTGFFIQRQMAAKKMMLVSSMICIVGSLVFFLPFSILWYISLAIISFFGGIFIASCGFYFKAYSKGIKRLQTMADVLIYSNIMMMIINILTVNFSAYLGLSLTLLALLGALGIAVRLEGCSEAGNNHRMDLELAQNNMPNIWKPLIFLCLFIVVITINSGLMYQVVRPAFSHHEMLTSYYWAIPYILALWILRNLSEAINRAYILFIALTMIGLSYILFMYLDKSVFSYIFIDTLMLGAFGVCDLFWWSIMGEIFDYHPNPAKILGIGLSMNVLGVLLGGYIGRIIFKDSSSYEASIMALVVIFIVMIMLPPLNAQLARLLKAHVFLVGFANLAHSQQIKVVEDFKDKKQLTERESEIVKLLLQGYTYKAMAEKLFITENTIKYHVKNIYQKLQVNNKMELIKAFTDNENKIAQ